MDTYRTSIGRRSHRRAGFTLSEIMIALGVIVVGLGMAAGAFHAGIRNHKTTMDEILRSMVGENAIAIAKVRLTEEIELPQDHSRVLDPLAGEIGMRDTWYPVRTNDDVKPIIGYLLFGSRPNVDRNDFKFTVIPYMLMGTGEANNVRVNTDVVANATITDSKPRDWEDGDPIEQSLLVPDRKTSRDDMEKLAVGTTILDIRGGSVTVATVVGASRRNVTIEPALTPGSVNQLFLLKLIGAPSGMGIEPLDPYYGRTPLPVARDPNHAI